MVPYCQVFLTGMDDIKPEGVVKSKGKHLIEPVFGTLRYPQII